MSTSTESRSPATRGQLIAAFAAIYIIWGSTYLGIRFAVETLPPFLMGSGRFLIAGVVLYAWLRLRGTPAPTRLQWRHAAIAAGLLLGMGNGGVNLAEKHVSSGLTALIIAGAPLWFALFEWLRPGGKRPTLQTVLGIVVGFAGVLLLVGSRSGGHGGSSNILWVLVVVGASMAWAIGSLYSKHSPHAESPMMVAAQQMISGGAIMLLIGIAMGEPATFHPSQVSHRSLMAFVYLTIIGSLVGFSAYAWLLKATTPARVSTYAYVNPVIAVFLGWALGGETLTGRMLLAAVVIVLGVVIITVKWSPPSDMGGGKLMVPPPPSTTSPSRG